MWLPEGVILQAGRTQGGFQLEAWQGLNWAPGRAVWQRSCYLISYTHHLHRPAPTNCLSYVPSGEPLAGAQTVGNSGVWPSMGLAWGADREQQEVHVGMVDCENSFPAPLRLPSVQHRAGTCRCSQCMYSCILVAQSVLSKTSTETFGPH